MILRAVLSSLAHHSAAGCRILFVSGGAAPDDLRSAQPGGPDPFLIMPSVKCPAKLLNIINIYYINIYRDIGKELLGHHGLGVVSFLATSLGEEPRIFNSLFIGCSLVYQYI